VRRSKFVSRMQTTSQNLFYSGRVNQNIIIHNFNVDSICVKASLK
jgi:hypothetical protein